jgi:dihydropyrimidinase
MSLLIRNGKIVTAERVFSADLFVEKETITRIGKGLRDRADRFIDAGGRLVIPGGVDPHTHLDMPYGAITSSDDFRTGTIAAACGGTTTIIDYAGQTKGRPLREGLEEWRRKAEGKAVIDYGFHMMVCDLPDKRLPEMTRLIQEGITSFKFFTAYPGRLMLDNATILKAMRRAAGDGSLICMHAEDGVEIEKLIQKALRSQERAPVYHARTRPEATEREAIAAVSTLAEKAFVILYVVHVSTGGGVAEIRAARDGGVKILGETCPQYLFLDESRYDREPAEAAKYVMSPPLRAKKNQGDLWKGLKSDDLQCVGTDHCPFLWKDKKRGAKENFTKIPGGGPGIQNRMSLLFGRLPIGRFVEVTSKNPAKIFGLYPKKGTIAVGSDADLVVFDPEREETISVSNLGTHRMRVDYSLYEGMKVRGFPEIVISRGEIVARDGKFVGKKGRGRFVKRGLPQWEGSSR